MSISDTIEQILIMRKTWGKLIIIIIIIVIIIIVNVSFQARVANSIPGLIHAHAINTKAKRIFLSLLRVLMGITVSRKTAKKFSR